MTGSTRGPWWRADGGWITHLMRNGTERLEFDPPTILMPSRGMRLRIIDHDTDSPVLEVQRFDRVIERHPMRAALSSVCGLPDTSGGLG